MTRGHCGKEVRHLPRTRGTDSAHRCGGRSDFRFAKVFGGMRVPHRQGRTREATLGRAAFRLEVETAIECVRKQHPLRFGSHQLSIRRANNHSRSKVDIHKRRCHFSFSESLLSSVVRFFIHRCSMGRRAIEYSRNSRASCRARRKVLISFSAAVGCAVLDVAARRAQARRWPHKRRAGFRTAPARALRHRGYGALVRRSRSLREKTPQKGEIEVRRDCRCVPPPDA